MKKISKVELIDILKKVSGAKPVNILTLTKVKMRKTANIYYDRITKFQDNTVFINCDYQAAVNRRLVKEGKPADFVSSPRKWGNRLTGTPLVEHNGNVYLECMFLKGAEPTYMLDGYQAIGKDKLEAFLFDSSSAKKQGLSEDSQVVLRDFNVNGIREIHINGERYIVE